MKQIRYYAIGHSYLKHGPFDGWQTDGYWGMAATKPENDYFHKFSNLMEKEFGAEVLPLSENHVEIERCCRADSAKETYETCPNFGHIAEVLQNFKPNVVSVFIGENTVCKDEAALKLFFGTLYEMINKYKREETVVICGSGSDDIANLLCPIAEKYGFVVCDCSIVHMDEGGRRPYYAFEDYPEYDEKAKMGGVEFRTHPGDAGHKKIAEIFFENAKEKISKIPDGAFGEEYEFEKYKKSDKVEKFKIFTEPQFFISFGGFNVRQVGDMVCFSSAPGTGASVSAYGICISPQYSKFYVEMSVGGTKKPEELSVSFNTPSAVHDFELIIPDDKMRRYEIDISHIDKVITRIFVKPQMDECFITIKAIGFEM